MKPRLPKSYTTLIILVVILSVANILFMIYQNKKDITEIQEKISVIHESQNITPINGMDGYTPIKGVDYFDGADGKDGRDGKDGANATSTHTIERETIVKEVPLKGIDGLTPQIKCNVEKNRWEIRYLPDSIWQILNGTPVRCTIE